MTLSILMTLSISLPLSFRLASFENVGLYEWFGSLDLVFCSKAEGWPGALKPSGRRARPPDTHLSVRRTRGGLDRKHFRAARGAVEHPIGQATHLGVAALAGVLARGAWQRDYLLKGQQHRGTQYAPTRAAAGTFATEGL